ncbi:FmdB family zinc ribbon protein [Fimbriiglobus ruber]|nr:zinc ribbon domain-containing protein [Fimbriiglobus ruber]
MPIYIYEVVLPDGTGGEQFETLQRMSEPVLTVHPESGEPVRRVIGVPNAPKTWTDSQAKTMTSDRNLDRMGFTKYVRSGNGKYEKKFGKGPDAIKKPPSE